MVSRCCKTDIFSHGEYYSCLCCHRPCDIVNFKMYQRSGLSDYRKWNPSTSENKIEEPFNQT